MPKGDQGTPGVRAPACPALCLHPQAAVPTGWEQGAVRNPPPSRAPFLSSSSLSCAASSFSSLSCSSCGFQGCKR